MKARLTKNGIETDTGEIISLNDARHGPLYDQVINALKIRVRSNNFGHRNGVNRVATFKEWTPFQGEHGGHGWKASDGEIRYQKEKPESGLGTSGDKPAQVGKESAQAGNTDAALVPMIEKADQAAEHIAKQGILAKAGAAGKWLKDKTAKVYNALEKRYGRKQAIAIFAAGHIVGLGSPLVVLPGSTLIGMVPFAALAEVYLQAKRGIQAMRHDEQPTLTPEQIRKLGEHLWRWLQEQWKKGQGQFDEAPAPAAGGGAVDTVDIYTQKPKRLFFSEDPKEVALPGHDGHQAEKLLKASKQQGVDVLNSITGDAVARLLHAGEFRGAEHLFTPEEFDKLKDQLAATIATAHLLGRSRIRLRAQKEIGEDDATPFFETFDEPSGIRPLSPDAALEYFRKLIPGLSPKRYGPYLERKAFSLAHVVEAKILRKVQDAIAERLETGEQIKAAPGAIEEVLVSAGVAPSNPQYAEAVFRTNMMDSYNAGAWREFQDPDLDQFTEVWKYYTIMDGRERERHHALNGLYFPRSVSFAEVRGTRAEDTINCRCAFAPVWKGRWRRLQEQGAKVSQWPIGGLPK